MQITPSTVLLTSGFRAENRISAGVALRQTGVSEV